MTDNFSKFSRVVDDYVRYRPRYPEALIGWLSDECGFDKDRVIADIGSGTGILTELLLKHGNRVYGVEPNDDMRRAAESVLKDYDQFTSISGIAEATTLDDHSVDLITAGQAFHWFERENTRMEFARILRPDGWVALVWNFPAPPHTAFDHAYEAFWRRYISPNPTISDLTKRQEDLFDFYGHRAIRTHALENAQVCDYDAFKGRILSSSSAPDPDHAHYDEMVRDIKRMFDAHQIDGSITISYLTRVYAGQLSEG